MCFLWFHKWGEWTRERFAFPRKQTTFFFWSYKAQMWTEWRECARCGATESYWTNREATAEDYAAMDAYRADKPPVKGSRASAGVGTVSLRDLPENAVGVAETPKEGSS